MTHASLSRFTRIHKLAVPIFNKRNFERIFMRYFSTCASPLATDSALPLKYSAVSCMLDDQLSACSSPQRSAEWFAVRQDKLTTSTFSTALGFWKGDRRYKLWHEKVYTTDQQAVDRSRKSALEWGVLNEGTAIERYKTITGHPVGSLGFAIHSDEKYHWIGASPDGLLESVSGGGVLEVKCPFNKGKPETMLPWSKMPHYYMPQVQGQLEVMNRDWADLYCWTPNGSTIFRINRDRKYWELMRGVLREFWWENVVPAREALLQGKEEEEVNSFKPALKHELTRLIILRSQILVEETKLVCRETSGHAEFYP